jgi:hypothetical protein
MRGGESGPITIKDERTGMAVATYTGGQAAIAKEIWLRARSDARFEYGELR